MLLSAGTIKLAFITQNNYVYEYTVQKPTPEVSLNVRNPYRRQKRTLLITDPHFDDLISESKTSTVNTHYIIIILLPTFYLLTYLLPTYLPPTYRPPTFYLLTYLPTYRPQYILIYRPVNRAPGPKLRRKVRPPCSTNQITSRISPSPV